MKKRWDIFCKVVDNFGDIGVCWRLAKQLAHEHGLQVRLFVDDLAVAQKIIPKLNLTQKNQEIQGINVLHWQAEPSMQSYPQSFRLLMARYSQQCRWCQPK